MTLPLSDAQTYEMPVPTRPIRVANQYCPYCDIKLSAIPDAPRQLDAHGPYYHPSCIGPARVVRSGLRQRVDAMLREAERD